MRIAVAGIGYVGLSLAVLLSQNNEVTEVDIVPGKVKLVNQWKSPIRDEYIEKYLEEHENRGLKLSATTNGISAYRDADYVIIAVPTDYDVQTDSLDCSTVDDVIEQVISTSSATIIIKSTVPVGYTERTRKKFHTNRILFIPEFLREGKALYDNLYPSRIIVGCDEESRTVAEAFSALLTEGAVKKDVPVLYMGFSEAEAVKLFSNTYLALRISFFNELDTFAEQNQLNVRSMIDGVCLDSRIGNYYNNPSFGYGGNCLPKDVRQLKKSFQDIRECLIGAIAESNRAREEYIAGRIMEKAKEGKKNNSPIVVGIYRLTIKVDSDNFRESSVLSIMRKIQAENVSVLIYEPLLESSSVFCDSILVNDLEKFKKQCDIIIANRCSNELDDAKEKVYTRDVFGRN